VRTLLEQLVSKRRVMDEAPAEFSTRSPEAEYAAAAEALRQVGAPSLEALVAALADPDPALGREAALALGRLGRREAAPPLAGCLGAADEELALAAIQALGELGDPQSGAALVAALPATAGRRRDAAAIALLCVDRERAVELLGRSGPGLGSEAHAALVTAMRAEAGPQLVSHLERLLELAPAGPQALCTLEALAAAAPEAAWPHLRGRLQGGDYTAFTTAFRLLEATQAPGLEAAASAALDHADSRMRRYAVEALGRLGGAAALARLAARLAVEPAVAVRAAMPGALAAIAQRTGLEVRPALAAALADPAPPVRHSACSALQRAGGNLPGAHSAPEQATLAAALGRLLATEADAKVLRAALEAIGALGDPGLAEAVRQLERNPRRHQVDERLIAQTLRQLGARTY
jgi:HEAT repeat protein